MSTQAVADAKRRVEQMYLHCGDPDCRHWAESHTLFDGCLHCSCQKSRQTVRDEKTHLDEVWENEMAWYWDDLLFRNGVVDKNQVKREMIDYVHLMDTVSEVYCELTGNVLSKTGYAARTVIEVHDERCTNGYDEDLEDIVRGFVEAMSHGSDIDLADVLEDAIAWVADHPKDDVVVGDNPMNEVVINGYRPLIVILDEVLES
jgi:hypothetical protein